MGKRLLLILALAVGICVPSFAEEAQTEQPTDKQSEQKVLSPEEILVEAYANNFDTLCFLYKKAGRCAACDRVKGDLKRLEEDDYPITYVYCDDPDNEDLIEDWEIEAVPTFVTVRYKKNGEAEEHSRFTGSFGVYNRISSLYRERLDFDPRKPHKPRPGILPPPRPVPRPEPKPSPGDNPKPRRGDPKPKSGDSKPHWYAPWTWF